MRENGIVFEISLVFWFLIIILELVFSLIGCLEILEYLLLNVKYGAIKMFITFLTLTLSLMLGGVNLIIHEYGHKFIFKILGEKSIIYKISLNNWATKPEHKDFYTKLKEKNILWCIYLNISGVLASTIFSLILTLLILAGYLITKNIYIRGVLSLFALSYNTLLFTEFIANLWSKKSYTDGYKVRDILNKKEVY